MDSLSKKQNEAFDAAMGGHNLLILGAAGTGKSFIIKKILSQLKKKGKTVALTCSTGIACHVYESDMKATTIHRFCGLEDGRHSPSEIAEIVLYSTNRQYVLKQIQAIDTLVIDEISMVSARTMQAVLEVLRLKDKTKPFGGIQVILTGDFMQLPPVKDTEYGDEGMYCFECPWFRHTFPHKIILTQIQRQSELLLIKAIEDISRGGIIKDETLRYIESLERELPESNSLDVTLFAKNEFVDDFNRKCILDMPGPLSVFKAEDSGDVFRLKKLIVPKVLWLKIGIPVILLRNLSDKLVNGLKGFVYDIDENGPIFEFPIVDIGYIRLEKIGFDVFSPRLQATVATRTQYPVKPGFGITIHKSQGMTLERVTVNCRDIFQAGQLGVAISRVKSASGLRVINFHPRVCVTQPDIVNKFMDEPSIQPGETLNCCITKIQRQEQHTVSGISKASAVANETEADDKETEADDYDEQFSDDFDEIIESLDAMDTNMLDFELPSDLSCEAIKKEITCSDPVTMSQNNINEILSGLSEYKLKCFCKKEFLFLTKLIDNLNISEPRAVPPKELAEFYSNVQKHMSSFEYNMSCISLFDNSDKNFQDDHKSICFQIHTHIRMYLLKQKANLYPSEHRNINMRFLTNPSKARVRYVAGYCVATLRYKFSCKKETHRFSLSKESEMIYQESCYAVSILTCMKESEQYLKGNTMYESSLMDTERRQQTSRGLTNVSDDTYTFFIKLSELCLSLLLSESLIAHGDKLFQFCFDKLLAYSELLDLFVNAVSKPIESVNMQYALASELTENNEMLQYQKKNVFRKIVKKYLMVQFVQFRKDVKSSFHVEKTMAHRKQIQISKSKIVKSGSIKHTELQETQTQAQTSEATNLRSKRKKVLRKKNDNVEESTEPQVVREKRVSKKTKKAAALEFDEEIAGTSTETRGSKRSRKRKIKKTKKVSSTTAVTYVNEDGETVWVCPSCGEEDDGDLKMIGCDICEEWFHWTCVNISEEPKEEMWFCPNCDNTN